MLCFLHTFMVLQVIKHFCLTLLQVFISQFLKPLDTLFNSGLLSTITEQPSCNNLIRHLLSLPIYVGGVGITEPSKVNSIKITASLVSLLISRFL